MRQCVEQTCNRACLHTWTLPLLPAQAATAAAGAQGSEAEAADLAAEEQATLERVNR